MFAAWLGLGASAWDRMADENGWWKAILVAAVCQLCLYYADLYDLRVVADRRELFVRALQSLGATSLILALVYFLFRGLILGPSDLVNPELGFGPIVFQFPEPIAIPASS